MPISIKRTGDRYEADATVARTGEAWSTDQLLTVTELIDRLVELGFHQQDIGDAFYDADPDWLTRGKEA